MKKYLLILVMFMFIMVIAGCSQKTRSNNNTITPPTNHEESSNTDNSGASEPQPIVSTPVPNQTVPAQPDDKTHSWYLTLNSIHEIPYVDPSIKTLLAEHNAFYVLPNNNNKIFLTFDCGYELGYTSQILDILQSNQVNSAFFVTGQYIHSQPDLVKRMKAEGHLVCNHTLNHPDLSTISPEQIQQEVETLDSEYEKITGYGLDRYLRPPMGNYSTQSLETTRQLGYANVFWSIALRDWDPNNQPGSQYSYQYVLNNIHPGAVILLHAVSKSDTEALDKIIKDLQTQGYNFATFNERD